MQVLFLASLQVLGHLGLCCFFLFKNKVIHKYSMFLYCHFALGIDDDVYAFEKLFTAFGERRTPNIPLIHKES
jgi:hypothetical protein